MFMKNKDTRSAQYTRLTDLSIWFDFISVFSNSSIIMVITLSLFRIRDFGESFLWAERGHFRWLLFSYIREEIMFVFYVCFFKSSDSSAYGFRLWFPKLRIILSALSITCEFLLYYVENNKPQDHYLSFLMQFWTWLRDRPLDTEVPSYCLMSFLSNPTFSGVIDFVISFFHYWWNFFPFLLCSWWSAGSAKHCALLA